MSKQPVPLSEVVEALRNDFGKNGYCINQREAADRIEAEGIAPSKCVWAEDEHEAGVYDTQCGNRFVFNDGTITDNSALFCMYCGGEIVTPASTEESTILDQMQALTNSEYEVGSD